MQKTRLSKKFYLALVIFSLIGQVAWVLENMYLNVFIYKMFNASAEQISLMVAASAIAATVTTLLIGALSDKIGKRKIFICGGYILWGISIICFGLIRMEVIEALFPATVAAASVGVTLVIIVDCIMTFFGSSANDAAFNAWLTDATDETNRGAAEGINAMMPLVAILVVFGSFMSLDQSKAESWTLIFSAIGGVVLLLGIAGFFLIEDKAVKTEENAKYFANIFYGFRPGVIKRNPALYMTLAALAVFNISIQIFMPYLILYYTEALGLQDYVLIFAPAIIVSAVFTALYGRVYDSKGFRVAVVPTMLLLAVGFVLLYFVRNTALVFVASLVMMCGYIGTGAMLGAAIRDLTPQNKAGMFQGLRIVGQVLIPGVIGPAIGAWVLRNAAKVVNTDGTESFIPNESIFLAALIALIAAGFVMIPLFKMMKKDK
jgi:MFS family permease